jgi:hypothetical protein
VIDAEPGAAAAISCREPGNVGVGVGPSEEVEVDRGRADIDARC